MKKILSFMTAFVLSLMVCYSVDAAATAVQKQPIRQSAKLSSECLLPDRNIALCHLSRRGIANQSEMVEARIFSLRQRNEELKNRLFASEKKNQRLKLSKLLLRPPETYLP